MNSNNICDSSHIYGIIVREIKWCAFQRVDKVDTLIRRTKMDAGEEARSRQYKGTAMSDDEASNKIAAFGIYDKSYRNKNAH